MASSRVPSISVDDAENIRRFIEKIPASNATKSTTSSSAEKPNDTETAKPIEVEADLEWEHDTNSSNLPTQASSPDHQASNPDVVSIAVQSPLVSGVRAPPPTPQSYAQTPETFVSIPDTHASGGESQGPGNEEIGKFISDHVNNIPSSLTLGESRYAHTFKPRSSIARSAGVIHSEPVRWSLQPEGPNSSERKARDKSFARMSFMYSDAPTSPAKLADISNNSKVSSDPKVGRLAVLKENLGCLSARRDLANDSTDDSPSTSPPASLPGTAQASNGKHADFSTTMPAIVESATEDWETAEPATDEPSTADYEVVDPTINKTSTEGNPTVNPMLTNWASFASNKSINEDSEVAKSVMAKSAFEDKTNGDSAVGAFTVDKRVIKVTVVSVAPHLEPVNGNTGMATSTTDKPRIGGTSVPVPSPEKDRLDLRDVRSTDDVHPSLEIEEIEARPKANTEKDREHALYFNSWPKLQERAEPAARVRKVILTGLPPYSNASFVASLVDAGALERIEIGATHAFVTFLSGYDCLKYYESTANGILCKRAEQEYVVTISMAKEVDVVGGMLRQWIDAGITRCVTVIGADKELKLSELYDIASRKSRKVETIVDGQISSGLRSLVFRFCNIANAVEFKNILSRAEDWEHCNIMFSPDPCAKSDTAASSTTSS